MYNVGVVGDHILVSVPSHVLLRGRNRSSLSGVDLILNKKLKFLEFHFMLILGRLEAGCGKDKKKSFYLKRCGHVQVLVDIVSFLDDDVRGGEVSLDGVNHHGPSSTDEEPGEESNEGEQ